jgi:lysophospholipase L1-like esterase
MLGTGYFVGNFGASGMCMLKGSECGEQWSYWNTAAFSNSRNWNPDIVIIMLGTNISCYGKDVQGWWGLPDLGQRFLAAYKEMIAVYQNLPSHPKVYCVTPPTVYQSDVPYTDKSERVLVNELVPGILKAAEDAGCTVIDVHLVTAGMPENFPDQIHPDTAGKQVIAKAIYDAIIANN